MLALAAAHHLDRRVADAGAARGAPGVNAVFTAYVGEVQAERVQAGRARGVVVQARDRLHEDVMGLGVRVRWHPRRVSGGASLWAVGV